MCEIRITIQPPNRANICWYMRVHCDLCLCSQTLPEMLIIYKKILWPPHLSLTCSFLEAAILHLFQYQCYWFLFIGVDMSSATLVELNGRTRNQHVPAHSGMSTT